MSELNRKIAEMRGWTDLDEAESELPFWANNPVDNQYQPVPDWEHDLNAAWPLFWELPVSAVIERDRRDILATLSWWVGSLGGWQHVTFDKTEPQVLATAICEAWLRSHEVVKP